MSVDTLLVHKDDVLEFGFAGLLPSTYHYVYIDAELVPSGYLKPDGGLLGDPLITDDNGNLSFEYFFVSGAYDVDSKTSFEDINSTRLYKPKTIVVCNVLANSFTDDAELSAVSIVKSTF